MMILPHFKICKRCKGRKPLGDFYVHAQMDDGHLSFCKECVKERVSTHYYSNHQEMLIKYRERDKKRCGTQEYNRKKVEYNKTWRTSKIIKAHNVTMRKLRFNKPDSCELCGNKDNLVGHHPNYNEPERVIWLCNLCHALFNNSKRAGGFLSPPFQGAYLLLPPALTINGGKND